VSRRNAVWALVRIYKWKLLLIALTAIIAVILKSTFADTQLPPGSVPTPNIDPL